MFDPEDFAKLGVRLVQNPCGHAESRTAISRAYYSTFLIAKQFLDPHFLFSKGGTVHDHVQMLFANCSSQKARDIGRTLYDMRRKRNDADYNVDDADVNSYHVGRVYNEFGFQTRGDVRALFSSASAGPTIEDMKAWAKASGVVRAK